MKWVAVSARRGALTGSVVDFISNDPDSGPDRDIVLCSCAKHFTLTVPLSNQVYKWITTNHPRFIAKHLATSSNRNGRLSARAYELLRFERLNFFMTNGKLKESLDQI